jgi:hypothetical protein
MDASNVPQPWFNGLFAALATLAFWIYRKLDRKVEKIGGDYVTRKELNEMLALHNARVEKMHEDNTRNFSELRTQLEGVNTKLFDLSGRIQI